MSIPNIIHQIWVGPNNIPDRSVHFIRRIQELHPEFEHRLWTNADLIPANFENYELIMSRPSWAQKADLMRYEILYRYGGVYLDIDFEVFKNLSDLLTHPLVVCNEDERIDTYMSIGFMACCPNHPAMLSCVKGAPRIDFTQPINKATGPWYFRTHFDLRDARVLPTSVMYPLHWKHRGESYTMATNTYAIHHWDKNW